MLTPKVFTAQIDGSGKAQVDVTHSLHGLTWIVMQLSVQTGRLSNVATVSADFNGIPFITSAALQPNGKGGSSSNAGGQPYAFLQAGDKLTVYLQGGNTNDIFTVAAHLLEVDSASVLPDYLPARAPSSVW